MWPKRVFLWGVLWLQREIWAKRQCKSYCRDWEIGRIHTSQGWIESRPFSLLHIMCSFSTLFGCWVTYVSFSKTRCTSIPSHHFQSLHKASHLFDWGIFFSNCVHLFPGSQTWPGGLISTFSILFFELCVCVCVCVFHAGVTDCCELADMGIEDQTQVLWKSSMCSWPLSHLSSSTFSLTVSPDISVSQVQQVSGA